MKRALYGILLILLALATICQVQAQQKIFTHALSVKNLYGDITAITEDKEGYIWFGCNTSIGSGGLHRFDGSEVISYMHNSSDTNSLSDNFVSALCIDSHGIVWIGTDSSGLNRLDPATGIFKHFYYHRKSASGISSNSITALLEDHSGHLWVGTTNGLDIFDSITGKFKHYTQHKNIASTLPGNVVQVIYEDKQNRLWVGTNQGLALLDRNTGKFTTYFPNPGTSDNSISAIFEDNKNTLWIGTYGSSLETLEIASGIFTHYHYDPAKPHELSPPPPYNTLSDPITFIQGDASGAIWIGAYAAGLNKYDPATKKITHYARNEKNNQLTPAEVVPADSLSTQAAKAFSSTNKLFWLATSNGNIYYLDPLKKNIPYFPIKELSANSFYENDRGDIWMATDSGLIYKNANGDEKIFFHDPHNSNSIGSNSVNVILPDHRGNLWFGTNGKGLDKYNPLTGQFEHYRHNEKQGNSLSNDFILSLFQDHNNDIWVGSEGELDKLDIKTGTFTHYYHNNSDSNSLSNNFILSMCEEAGNLWAASMHGLNKLNEKNGQWKHYLPESPVKSVYIDSKNTFWAGASEGLYEYNRKTDQFEQYIDPGTGTKIDQVLNIIEDNNGRLWITTTNAIYLINKKRDRLVKFGPREGVHINQFIAAFNYKAKDGELFIGDQGGYYAFYPGQFNENGGAPVIHFTGFDLKNKKVKPGTGSPLPVPVYLVNKIKLAYDQNTFSFEFLALHFTDPDSVKYQYMLENYDDVWHDLGFEHRVNFFSVPPGGYVLKIKAINSNDTWSEKDMVIAIKPPWWTTGWAILMFICLLVGIVWGIIYYRSKQLRRKNKVLEEKVNMRTSQLKQSLEELKSTQAQLIQSEKMASLGELTAGIAHEIQNPLNFVNNFSEVNKELIEEIEIEKQKENGERDEELEAEILNDIKQNTEKIIHHGKRAGAIVKSMLEHSKSSSGVKEPTDINKLVDEYLQLAYHGLRAKDKSFDKVSETIGIRSEFEQGIPKLNIVPQDIGRVLLNVFNNAFYAVNEKKKGESESYKAVVSVETKSCPSVDGEGRAGVEIIVTDNGNGIPQKIIGKIFQPFFTTKPTGQGTGLGLSLAYDIIKAQGGEIRVETKEGEGSKFIVSLPTNS